MRNPRAGLAARGATICRRLGFWSRAGLNGGGVDDTSKQAPTGARGEGKTPMNRVDRRVPLSGPADVEYLDGDFKIRKPGAFVVCAATGVQIPLEELRYWNVDRQEPYAGPEAKIKRLEQLGELTKQA